MLFGPIEKAVWETVAGQVVHRLPSGLFPQPPEEIIAREAEYRRDRQCGAKVLPSTLSGKVADMYALVFTFKQSFQNLR